MSTRIISSSQNIESKHNASQNNGLPWYITYPAAMAAGGIFNYTAAKLSQKMTLKDVKNLSQYITPSIVDKTMNLPEIQKLGVTLNDTKWEGFTDDMVKELKKEAKNLNNKSLSGKLWYKLKKLGVNFYRKSLHVIPSGRNATYTAGIKTINLSKNRGGAFVFHELGHAKNFNSAKSGMKILTKLRNPIISSLIMTTGLACAFIPKSKGEEAETFWGQTKNILRDSSIGITAAGALAIPLEEGIASLKGAKIAKQILPKEQFKMINKMNGKALLSYLGVATGTILTTYIAKKLTEN